MRLWLARDRKSLNVHSPKSGEINRRGHDGKGDTDRQIRPPSKTRDLRATLLKIRDSIHNGLDFDRAAIFLYDPKDNFMQGSYGTDRSGQVSEEWEMRFGIN